MLSPRETINTQDKYVNSNDNIIADNSSCFVSAVGAAWTTADDLGAVQGWTS